MRRPRWRRLITVPTGTPSLVGGVLVRHLLEVDEHDGLADTPRGLRRARASVGGESAVVSETARRGGPGVRIAGEHVERVALAAAATAARDEDAEEDLVNPRLRFVPGAIVLLEPKRALDRVLHEILGEHGGARHAERAAEELGGHRGDALAELLDRRGGEGFGAAGGGERAASMGA